MDGGNAVQNAVAVVDTTGHQRTGQLFRVSTDIVHVAMSSAVEAGKNISQRLA